MSGSGGVSGAVSFPLYVEDFHGLLMADTQIFDDGSIKNVDFHQPIRSIINLANAAWTSASPYASFQYTSPTTDLVENRAQFDLFYSAATNYDIGNFASYIAEGLKAVTQPTTGELPELSQALSLSAPSTPQDLFISFATTLRQELSKNLTLAKGDIEGHLTSLVKSAASDSLASLSLMAATTQWLQILSAVTTELKKCELPKDVSTLEVINEADTNTQDNLKAALRIVNQLISGSITKEIISTYAARRETTYQQQISQYAGTMADVNAVNSSAFLFGMALLRSEQMREVADFDAQISFQLLQQGLSAYITVNAAQLQVSQSVHLANASAHNALLQASIQLLAILHAREEITPRDLLSLYTQLFAAEMQTFSFMAQAGVEGQANLYGTNVRKEQVAHTLQLQADVGNKVAKEQRYQMGMGQIYQILTNRVEFERAAAALFTEQNRIKTVALSEYETASLETDIRGTLWDLEIGRYAIEMLAAPAGMAGVVPKTPPKMQSALGGTLQGAAAGAAAGVVAGPAGAGAGALIGGYVGLIGGLMG